MTARHSAIGNFGALAAALLAATMVQAAVPATQDPTGAAQAQPPVEELQELDEVVVRGTRLINAIAEAEDRFYKLFNELNKDDRYDMSCPSLNLSGNSSSRISTRLCIPGFVADAMADWVVYKASCEPEFANFDANRDGRISRMEANANSDLMFQFDDLDQDGDGQLDQYGEFPSFERWALMNLNCYRPPTPELVLMDGTDAWYRHMLKVTNSDPRLKEMADHLGDMYHELNSVRKRYQDIEAAKPAGTVRRGVGPRPN